MDVIKFTTPYAEWFIDKLQDKQLSASQQQLWLLCGLHVHPKHCALHLALYRWNLKNANVQDAADELSKILQEFPDDPELIRYLSDLIVSVNSLSTTVEVEVFKSLSLTEQQSVYLTVASSQIDKLACTSTVLQMMRAYPTSIAQHAITAAKVLIKHEQQQGADLGSINPLRRMLILELMPLILSKGTEFLDTLTETVVTLFVQLIAHYYIECASVTDPAIKEEYKITDPWSDLKESLVKFASLHNWRILPDFQSSDTSVLLRHVTDVTENTDHTSYDPGLFYCILFIMFEHSFKYIKLVDTHSLILVKRAADKPIDKTRSQKTPHDNKGQGEEEEEAEPARKRRRTLSVAESYSNIATYFTLAETCYSFLRRTMTKQLSGVSEELNVTTWRWYSLFLTDVAVYDSDEDLAAIQQTHSTNFSSDELRVITQQALCSSGPTNTLKSVWTLLDNLPPESTTPTFHPTPDVNLAHPISGNVFTFVLNSRSKLCLHVCRTLVNMVQSRIPKTRQSDILALLLIIYQYDIGEFSEELARTIEAVKSVKTFKYKGLLSHVTEVVLLEELLHLTTHCDVRLDVSSDVGKKRFSKDDVTSSIRAHVQHCKDSSEETVIRFLLDHREVIETRFSQYAFGSP